MAGLSSLPSPADYYRGSLAERLERGEVEFVGPCPFSVPVGADLDFMLQQRLASRAHKNISYDPHTGKTAGFAYTSQVQAARLHKLLSAFSVDATAWLSRQLPDYAKSWRLDRVSYRPEEEATRNLRLNARNDLLHVDAFPSRPTNGWRIMRLFVNINPVDPRVWATSFPFAKLLETHGAAAGLPSKQSAGWMRDMGEKMLRVFRPNQMPRSAYDSFMHRFHNYLKANEEFQEHTPKKFWHFPSGACWMVLTDTASHSVLRGRYALEHSYFVSPDSLALPNESPAALLERACGMQVLRKAA